MVDKKVVGAVVGVAEWYVPAFIPDYGIYYYNINTESFEVA